jgi:hypothetical protein
MRKFKFLWVWIVVAAFAILTPLAFASFGVKGGTNHQFTTEITDVQFGSGVNWSTTGAVLNHYGVNWSAINGINMSAINWVGTNFLTGGAGAYAGINWTNVYITNSGINWYDMVLQQSNQGLTTGVNWNDLNPVAGGINWMTVTKSAADNTILCVKAGQIGKCYSGFSSTGAGSCNCM